MSVSRLANNIKNIHSDKHSKIANYQSIMRKLASQVENKCAVTNKLHVARKKACTLWTATFSIVQKFRNVKKISNFCVWGMNVWYLIGKNWSVYNRIGRVYEKKFHQKHWTNQQCCKKWAVILDRQFVCLCILRIFE